MKGAPLPPIGKPLKEVLSPEKFELQLVAPPNGVEPPKL